MAVPAVVAAAGAGGGRRRAAWPPGAFPCSTSTPPSAPIAAEHPRRRGRLGSAPGVVPDPLVAAGMAAGGGERSWSADGLVEAWLDDPAGPDPVLASGCGWPPAPVLEAARAADRHADPGQWAGAACPACGGLPQVSVIAEESGEFMGGSPRSLVCGRCAGWWTFPRAHLRLVR